MDQVPIKRYIRLEVLLRIAADVIMLNGAIVCGLLARVVILRDVHYEWTKALEIFSQASLFLSTVGPIVFSAMGFYTKGRFYMSRYKAVAICQATTLLFLLFGTTNYLIGNHEVSRLVVVVAWFVGTVLLGTARLWAWLWELVLNRETVDVSNIVVQPNSNRILLIGGAGYIGSSLLPRLLQLGYQVRLFDAFLYGAESIEMCSDHPRLEVIKADFRNVHDLVYAMRGVNSVIHLGAIVGDPACSLDEDLTIEVNLLATRTIAEVAKANGVRRLIFASTCSVYGSSDETLDERSLLNPVSLYARSKIACERVLLNLRASDFMPIILRFGTVYGLSGRTRFDLVVNLLVAKALMEGKITVIGPDQWRPFLHVHDAAKAVRIALQAPTEQLSEHVFNVGSDEQNYTLRDVGELIKRTVPSAHLICTESQDDRRNYKVTFGRIRKMMNFVPDWTLEAGIHQVAAAILGGNVTDYRHSKYSNVKLLSEQNGNGLRTQSSWAREMLGSVEGPVARSA